MKLSFKSTMNILTLSAVISILACGNSTLDTVDPGGQSIDKFTVFTTEDGLSDNIISDILVDYTRDGVWFTTFNGISFYSKADSSITSYGAEYDIPKMETTSLAIDYISGRIWAGTVSGPTSFIDSTWTAFADIDNLVHRYVTSVASFIEMPGTVWFGTKGGVSSYSGKGWTAYTFASGLIGDDITSIARNATGDIWIGSTSGISVYDGDVWTLYGASTLPSTWVRAIFRAFDGTMWCGTANGMTAFNNGIWRRYGTADGLPSGGINDFAADGNGRIWAATDGGVALLSGEIWQRLDLPSEVDSAVVSALGIDVLSGEIWIGTESGVVRYETAGI